MQKAYKYVLLFQMHLTGLEPARLAALEPKSNVSASFTTGAYPASDCIIITIIAVFVKQRYSAGSLPLAVTLLFRRNGV